MAYLSTNPALIVHIKVNFLLAKQKFSQKNNCTGHTASNHQPNPLQRCLWVLKAP